MLETTPIVTMMAVMVRGGAICTILRTRASIRPDLSATPIPIMATRMIPTGPKFMKLATADVQMKRMPSADNRPWTFVVTSSTPWVCGLIRRYVALTPSHCSTCESNTKIAIRREKSTAGCGTAFPTRSTVSSARFISVLVAPLDPLMIRSLRSLVGGTFHFDRALSFPIASAHSSLSLVPLQLDGANGANASQRMMLLADLAVAGTQVVVSTDRNSFYGESVLRSDSGEAYSYARRSAERLQSLAEAGFTGG